MRAISNSGQRSYRAKSLLPDQKRSNKGDLVPAKSCVTLRPMPGLRRRPAPASSRLLTNVPHCLRPGGARNAARGSSTTGC